MWSDVDAVLFDLDGTLVDTIPLIFASYQHAFSTHLPDFHPERRLIVNNLGRSLDDILYDYAVAGGADDPATLSRTMKDTYRAFQRKNLASLIRPYPGMKESLEALRDAGLKIGIVTSKTDWAARESYEHYDLGQFFSVGVFHDDTTRHKPDPEPLLLAASRGGLDPARCVYVGDSIHDMAAGKAARMRTIAALWGPSEREELVQAGADELATVPLDLVPILVRPSAPLGEPAA